MKKSRFFLIGALIVTALVSGCSSAPVIWDNAVPAEQSSTLIINNYLRVNLFDAQRDRTETWTTSSFNKQEVILPSGSFVLTVGTTMDTGGYRYEGEVSLTPEFLPGHTYYLFGIINTITRNFMARIVDAATLEAGLMPDQGNPNASPLEGEWNRDNTESIVFSGDQFIRTIGTNQGRGFYEWSGNAIYLYHLFWYENDAWAAAPGIIIQPATYNGTTLELNRGQVFTKQ